MARGCAPGISGGGRGLGKCESRGGGVIGLVTFLMQLYCYGFGLHEPGWVEEDAWGFGNCLR